MKRIALLVLLLPISLAAQAPSPEDAVAAYAQLPWVRAKAENVELVCLPQSEEPKLDTIVPWLANRAKGTCI